MDLDLVTTVPNVEYHVYHTDGTIGADREPGEDAGGGEPGPRGRAVREGADRVAGRLHGPIMTLGTERRGLYKGMKYLTRPASSSSGSFPLARSSWTSTTG